MSKRQNQNILFWKDVEDSLRRIEVRYQGKLLASEDARLIKTSILLQAMVMTDLRIGRAASLREWKSWAIDIARIDFYSLSVSLKDWINYFRNYVPGWSQTYVDFKHQQRKQYPFAGAFWAPVRGDVEDFFTSGSSNSFAVLNQHLCFLTRVNLRSVDFSEQMTQEYLQLEAELAQQILPSEVVVDLNTIISEWLQDLSWEDYHPKHGNGAVAFLGRAPLWQKYENMSSDHRLRYTMRGAALDALPAMPEGLDRCCEVRFVPKSALTWRTISMEPATLQFVQQGYFRGVDLHCQRHPYVSKRIDFSDQSRNKLLAMEGSANGGSFATIDLSSASDRVSWELAKSVFRKTPLERPIWASRSGYALLPSGERIALHKFAPMGSALCFPVETLVFASVCEYVIRTLGHEPRDSRYVVYGDDIVIEAVYAPYVCEILSSLSFKVNESKTFIARNLPFRESCGGEYYHGVDVTPFRISRSFSGRLPEQQHPEVIQAYIDLANEAGRLGFGVARLWFIHELAAALPQRLMPPFSEGTQGIFSENATNFHLKAFYHEKKDLTRPSYQCWMLKCGCAITKRTKASAVRHEPIRLYEWLRQTRFRKYPVNNMQDVAEADLSREIPCWATREFYCPYTDTHTFRQG